MSTPNISPLKRGHCEFATRAARRTVKFLEVWKADSTEVPDQGYVDLAVFGGKHRALAYHPTDQEGGRL